MARAIPTRVERTCTMQGSPWRQMRTGEWSESPIAARSRRSSSGRKLPERVASLPVGRSESGTRPEAPAATVEEFSVEALFPSTGSPARAGLGEPEAGTESSFTAGRINSNS